MCTYERVSDGQRAIGSIRFMILINVKFFIREDKMADWLPLAESYQRAVRAEPGNVFFTFAQSLEDPLTFVCVEGFVDANAGSDHMQQLHVAQFFEAMPDIVSRRPEIIYVDSAEISGFVEMGEIEPRQ